MQRYVIPTVVIALWLFLWTTDTGLLVFTKRDGSERDCYYSRRCRLFSRV
jgi:hypothetical protein